MIYLASPYSDPDPGVREARFRAACAEAARLMAAGELVYSPIAHSHCIAAHGLPGDWTFWQEHSLAMLRRCDELAVLALDGWQESVGVARELEAALAMRLPVRRIVPREETPAGAGA